MKNFKINGMSVRAESIADAIHQVKDAGSFSGTTLTINSAADISLSKIIQTIKKSVEGYHDKVIKIANGKVYDHRRSCYFEVEFQIYIYDEFKERETWASIPIDFKVNYDTLEALSKQSNYAIQKIMSEISQKLKSYENKVIYEDKTYRTDSFDSITDSPASEIVKEIKSKYPQVKIKQETRKTYHGNGHKTKLSFSNYPGEGYNYSSTDPRKKAWENWIKFLEYLYIKYTHDNKSYNVRWNVSSEALHIFDPPLDELIADTIYQVKDSAASDIVREIKSKYPQVKIRQTSKAYSGIWGPYHKTTLSFSNYPGEGYDFSKSDPRKKEWEAWFKFLKYLYIKYTHDNSDTGILNHVGAHELLIITSLKDSI